METLAAVTMAPRKPPPAPPKLATLAERLRHAREASGLTLRALAVAADVPHPTIAYVESGRQADLKATDALRLADALGVDVRWLVAGE